MTEEHKAKMKQGRADAKAGIVKPAKIVKPKVKKIMTDELKEKMKQGRIKAKELNDSLPEELKKHRKKREVKVKKTKVKYKYGDKITVYLTNNEKDSYDFFKPIREAYRAKGNYKDYQKLLTLISNPAFCKDVHWIRSQVAFACNVEVMPCI